MLVDGDESVKERRVPGKAVYTINKRTLFKIPRGNALSSKQEVSNGTCMLSSDEIALLECISSSEKRI